MDFFIFLIKLTIANNFVRNRITNNDYNNVYTPNVCIYMYGHTMLSNLSDICV
jgi:hypothetical protein